MCTEDLGTRLALYIPAQVWCCTYQYRRCTYEYRWCWLTTSIESVCLQYVVLAELNSLSNHNARIFSLDSVQVVVPREEVAIVVHDAVVIVADSQGVHLRARLLVEVGPKARENILVEDVHIVVSVRPTLLMPEPNSMANLMHYCAEGKAPWINGNALLTISKSTHV